MSDRTPPAFAVWLTGRPAAGKSTIAVALARELRARGVDVAHLESDAVRRVLTPAPTYTDTERDIFYGALTFVGGLLVDHGVPVVFDATANRRAYRDAARARIARFVEVFVDTPADVCAARDPKGIYRRAQRGDAPAVPGFTTVYEAPVEPDLRVSGEEPPHAAAARIVALLTARGYVS